MSLHISKVKTESDLNHIKQLFTEYQEWLDEDICFQGFENELKNLPGKYDCLLLARWNNEVCGGVGIYPIPERNSCEIKRLYVRDNFQKKGIGRELTIKIEEIAKELGYRHIYLETLDKLASAIRLYESLGFQKSTPYHKSPVPKVVYMEKSI